MESKNSGRNRWALPRAGAWVAAWLLLLLVLYVSAYYALVVPGRAQTRSGTVVVIPIYRTEWMEVLFEPMHRVDRVIRWRTWNP